MKFLLDTHTFLWFVNEDPSLSQTARALLEGESNDLFLSVASLWEIAIKMNIGKLSLGQDFAQFISEQIATNDIQPLPIEIAHLSALVSLPIVHRDPFDRLIVAQAKAENLPLISRDMHLDAYGVQRLW